MITHGPHFAVVDLLVLTTDTPKGDTVEATMVQLQKKHFMDSLAANNFWAGGGQ